jgi:flagellar protein FliS
MESSALLSYRTTRVANLDTRRQVLALYDRSIQLSKQAVVRFGLRDVAGALERLDQCAKCVGELQGALNFYDGEEIAVNLWRLYELAQEAIGRAGQQQNEKPLEDVLFILETLRDGWMQVLGLKRTARTVIVRTYREPTQVSLFC